MKKTLSYRQCISFHATGCHFTGPVALRLRLSSDLPIILFPLSLCKKLNFIIRLHHTVHKKNMTAFLLKNDKKAVSGAFSILFSASSLVANSLLLLRNKKTDHITTLYALSFYSYKSSCSFTSLLSAMHCFKATIIFSASSGFAR